MKIGKLSKLNSDNTTITSSETALEGFPPDNVLSDETLRKWKVQDGTVTLTIEFSSLSLDSVCLFNIDIEDEVTLKTFNSLAVETNSITKTQADLVGLDSINAYFELADTVDIEKIQVITNGATSSFETTIGFLWAGDLLDFGQLEAFAPTDEGTDDAIITRANSVSTQPKYNFQRFKFTTNKDVTFETLQGNVRAILVDGYTRKRPFIIEDCVYEPASLILGIFDTGVFSYDLLDPNKDFAQMVKGVVEVF